MPLTRLTLEERIRVVRLYSKYEKASTIQLAWRKEFGTDPPTRKTIAALNKKFDETGSVADLSRTGRPKTSRTEEKIALVQNAIKNDPTKSIRILSSELGVNKAAVHRIKQDADKQGFLKHENKKLKEKINQLQHQIDILEGKKIFKVRKANRNVFILPDVKNEHDEPNIGSLPFIFSQTIDNEVSKPKFEVLRIEDENGQHLSLEHTSHSTVITVLTNPNSDNHTFELSDGDEVRHLTIDANGQLQEIDDNEITEDSGLHVATINGDIIEAEEVVIQTEQEMLGHDVEEMEASEAMTTNLLLDEHQESKCLGHEDDDDRHNLNMEHEILSEDIPVGEEEELVDCTIEMPICFITATDS